MIYFDNAATTAIKPDSVIKAVVNTMKNAGGNPGRGGHILSLAALETVYSARETVAAFLNIDNPERICFVNNATTALNYGIKGVLKKGDHAVISSFEHNSVLRPMEKLKEKGVTYDVLGCDENGDFDDIENLIKPETKLFVINHVSNVTGSIADIEKIGSIAKKHGILFMVDASQSAGHVKIDVKKCNIDILATAGHKGLFGPQGTGIFYVKEGLILDTLIEGGTGSMSELFSQPLIIPDRFEAGTLNVPGIAGLKAGIDFVSSVGISNIKQHEQTLTEYLLNGLEKYENIKIYGKKDTNNRIGVVSFNIEDFDSVTLASYFSDAYGVCVRGGLHCAYLSHKTLGTLEKGCVRISFSVFNTEKEVRNLLNAVDRIA